MDFVSGFDVWIVEVWLYVISMLTIMACVMLCRTQTQHVYVAAVDIR